MGGGNLAEALLVLITSIIACTSEMFIYLIYKKWTRIYLCCQIEHMAFAPDRRAPNNVLLMTSGTAFPFCGASAARK